MNRITLLALAAFSLAGCADQPATPLAPTEAASLNSQGNGATSYREEFRVGPVTIRPMSQCLGGRTLITGMLSGWDHFTFTSNRRIHINEYLDMSELTLTFGGQTWTAGKGSHETWSVNISRETVSNWVHHGRTRFTSDGDGPDLRFVHHLQFKRHPDGRFELLRNIFEVQCIGQTD